MLNKFGPSGHGEAQVQYLDGDFRVISPGTYVRCAVTDARIPLDELKYWSVDLQEAYAIPSAVLQRHFPGALKTQGCDTGDLSARSSRNLLLARLNSRSATNFRNCAASVEFQRHRERHDIARPARQPSAAAQPRQILFRRHQRQRVALGLARSALRSRRFENG